MPEPMTETLNAPEATTPQDTFAPVPRRRRTSKPDAVLAEARETARTGILEIAEGSAVGSWQSVRGEEDRLSTHLFECTLRGYRGWSWFATLSRAPRAKNATVCEVGLIPGEDALLAPAWVPWADRLRPEDIEEDRRRRAEEEGTAAPASEPISQSPDGSTQHDDSSVEDQSAATENAEAAASQSSASAAPAAGPAQELSGNA